MRIGRSQVQYQFTENIECMAKQFTVSFHTVNGQTPDVSEASFLSNVRAVFSSQTILFLLLARSDVTSQTKQITFEQSRLKSSFGKFYCQYNELVSKCNFNLTQFKCNRTWSKIFYQTTKYIFSGIYKRHILIFLNQV